MYAADLKYVTGTDQLHITIFKKLVITENVKPNLSSKTTLGMLE